MPYRDIKQKQVYNRKYHSRRLGSYGSYNTKDNITYPSYLDSVNTNYSRNPIDIGRRRVREFKGILPKEYPQHNGHHIWINRVEGRGIDVKIRKNGKIHTVIELTNYGKKSYMSDETCRRYRRIFSEYKNVEKVLVISYPSNVSVRQKSKFRKNGISVKVMGYQA